MLFNSMAVGNPQRNPDVVGGAAHAVTSTPTPLPIGFSAVGWVLKAGSQSLYADGNAAVIWVGGADLGNNSGAVTNGYPLAPGEMTGFAVNNRAAICVCVASGTGVIYSAGS